VWQACRVVECPTLFLCSFCSKTNSIYRFPYSFHFKKKSFFRFLYSCCGRKNSIYPEKNPFRHFLYSIYAKKNSIRRFLYSFLSRISSLFRFLHKVDRKPSQECLALQTSRLFHVNIPTLVYRHRIVLPFPKLGAATFAGAHSKRNFIPAFIPPLAVMTQGAGACRCGWCATLAM